MKLPGPAFALLVVSAPLWAETFAARPLTSAGHAWTYYTAGSAEAGGGKAAPLVLLFHGTGGSGGGFLDKSGWVELAERNHFVVAAPSGLARQPEATPDFFANPRVWNTGFGQVSGPRGAVRDDLFVLDLVHDLEASRHTDPRRVFLVGHSNGASFCFRLAAEMPDRWAAIAPVMGVVPPVGKLARPVPTVAVYGERDRVLPAAGGSVDSPWGGSLELLPLPTQLQRWAADLGFEGEPQIVSDDEGQTTHRYGENFEVVTLKGHGHNYPQAGYPMLDARFGPVRLVGETTPGERIWSFFSRFPVGHPDAQPAPALPGPTDSVLTPHTIEPRDPDTVDPATPGPMGEPTPAPIEGPVIEPQAP